MDEAFTPEVVVGKGGCSTTGGLEPKSGEAGEKESMSGSGQRSLPEADIAAVESLPRRVQADLWSPGQGGPEASPSAGEQLGDSSQHVAGEESWAAGAPEWLEGLRERARRLEDGKDSIGICDWGLMRDQVGPER